MNHVQTPFSGNIISCRVLLEESNNVLGLSMVNVNKLQFINTRVSTVSPRFIIVFVCEYFSPFESSLIYYLSHVDHDQDSYKSPITHST